MSGWKLSDSSIRAGLETTYLLGRSQVLSPGEAEALGLPKTTIMLDGGSPLLIIFTYTYLFSI